MDIYRIILENLTSGIISLDIDGIILYINPMAEKILHIKRNDIVNKKYNIAFSIYPELNYMIDNMIKNNKTIRRDNLEITHGSIILRIGYSSMFLKDDNGRQIGYNIIFQDMDVISKYGK